MSDPQFPLYIPSKSRSDTMLTSKALTTMNVNHYIVIEPDQMDDYIKAIKHWGLLATPLELDLSYKDKYELCDNLGLTRSTGPGPARNFAWDHSIANGYDWHWVMDDNIKFFARLYKNKRIEVKTGSFFKAMEDFVLRYKNVAMAGPNYKMFAIPKTKYPPFITNTRIYSCNFIRNSLSNRWRGRYNEDTILSIDLLKKGWCTIQFYAFLQEKLATQTLKGGNTEEFYHAEGKVEKGKSYATGGTTAKSQMLVNVHPDVVKLRWRFGRVHHLANYRLFKNNMLILRDDINISNTPNEYGMTLKKLDGGIKTNG